MTKKIDFLVNDESRFFVMKSIVDISHRIEGIERDLPSTESGHPDHNSKFVWSEYHMAVHLAASRLLGGLRDKSVASRRAFIIHFTGTKSPFKTPTTAVVFERTLDGEATQDAALIGLLGDTPYHENFKLGKDEGGANASLIAVGVSDMARLIHEIANEILIEYPLKTLNQKALEYVDAEYQ